MNMIEKMQLLMDEQNLSKADVSKGSELPYSTIDNLFKRGFEKTSYPTIKKLAIFFNVDMNYLITDEVEVRKSGKMSANDISAEEVNLLNLWRKLSKDEQMKIIGRIEAKLEY